MLHFSLHFQDVSMGSFFASLDRKPAYYDADVIMEDTSTDEPDKSVSSSPSPKSAKKSESTSANALEIDSINQNPCMTTILTVGSIHVIHSTD
jgi:hypothetical protein